MEMMDGYRSNMKKLEVIDEEDDELDAYEVVDDEDMAYDENDDYQMVEFVLHEEVNSHIESAPKESENGSDAVKNQLTSENGDTTGDAKEKENKPENQLKPDQKTTEVQTDEITAGVDEEVPPEIPADLSSWMKNLPAELKMIPITKLCIPGSHDTGAFHLHTDMPLAHDQKFNPILRALGKLKSVRTIIRNWSETQSVSIADQLKLGVRYLDLRVELAMCRSFEINPYLVHGLYGITGPPFMVEIKQFLDENTEEVVILDVNHVYQMTEHDFLRFFVRPMEKIFGRDAFCPVMVDIGESTLNELIETNHRLILVGPYNHDVDNIVYSRYAVSSPWPNVNNVQKLVKIMEAVMKKDYNNLHVLQGVLTARATDIGRNLFDSLKNVFSMESLKTTIEFVKNMSPELRPNLNIVISDQICEEFTRTVIEQNAKVEYRHQPGTYRGPF